MFRIFVLNEYSVVVDVEGQGRGQRGHRVSVNVEEWQMIERWEFQSIESMIQGEAVPLLESLIERIVVALEHWFPSWK